MAGNDRKTSITHHDLEKIEIKPAIDLIPDEYERENNGNILVEVVHPDGEWSIDNLTDNFTTLGYVVDKSIATMNKQWIDNFITRVHEKIEKNSYDGLLMVFDKVDYTSKQLQYIWGKFTTATCPALKNKPKIFIFQVRKSTVDFDFHDEVDLRAAYDTPSEADILIIHDIYALDPSSDFLQNFNEHIKNYGHQEDIISLASISLGSEHRPLVISTMTRKFFFIFNKYRGNHHIINKTHNETKKLLEDLREKVKTLPSLKAKNKERGFFNVIRSSFRNGHMHNKELKNGDKENNKHQVTNENKEKKSSESKSNSKEILKPLTTPTRPASMTPSTSERVPTRYRNTSTSTMNSKEDITKKPPWK